ncbi:MAG: hypothetical protein WKF97_02765 [Chitinophagaceae bacterium]
MDLLRLQQGLLYWFRMNGSESKSYTAIENTCINICRPYFPMETNSGEIARFAKHNIFFPLFRLGAIEFYGDGKYAMAPTSCLCNKKYVIGCNMPHRIKEEYNLELVHDTLRGIEIYRRSTRLLEFICTEGISHSEYLFSAIFGKIPSLDTLVNFWEDDVSIDASGYQMLVSGDGWRRPTEPVNIGVFRKSDKVYSQRLAKISNYQWKLIPSRASNPDALNIASMWAEPGNISGVVFNSSDLLLRIKNNMFPLLIERILAINSLMHGCQLDSQRQYHLTAGEFNMLNRILGNKIEVQ